MARKSRPSKDTTGLARNTSYRSPLAASSRVWADLPSIYPAILQSPVSRTHRVHPHRPVRGLAKAPNRPTRAINFGSWSLPSRITAERLKSAHTCAKRHRRREVLFATRSTGAGSHGRRLYFSNRRC